jgi:hypothetical protein
VALLGAVTAWALVLRAGGLDPRSLWLDDAWVALVHRAEGLDELRLIGASAPGFVLALGAWLEVVGFSEAAAQALPLAAGVVAPAAGFLLARRLAWHRPAALVAALVLAAAPQAVDHAVRVKQYTVESLLAIGLLALAAHLLAEPGRARRWAALVVVGGAATAVSAFLGLYVGAGVAAGLVAARRRRDRGAARLGLVAGAAYALAAGAWYALVLAPVIPAALSEFWRDHFVVVDDGLRPALDDLGRAATGVAEGLSALPVAVVLGAVALGLAAVALQRLELAVLLAAPTAAAVVLAALERAPLGGGRTDIYLYPGLALAVAGGVERLGGVAPRALGPAAAAVVAVAVVATAAPATPYPVEDVAPLVAVVDRRAAPGDAVLVYPATAWAHALYTDGAVDLARDASSAWGFAPRFADPATYVLPPGRSDPSAYAPTVARVAAAHDRVWLVASHWAGDYAALQAQLADAGFRQVEVLARQGAELGRWQRP